MSKAGFVHRHAAGIDMLLDGPQAKARDAVHLVFAGEKVRPEYLLPTPDVAESEPSACFRLLSLESLVRMKLTSFRDKDRMHLRDMLEVGLIDATWRERFPPELAARLQELVDHPGRLRSWHATLNVTKSETAPASCRGRFCSQRLFNVREDALLCSGSRPFRLLHRRTHRRGHQRQDDLAGELGQGGGRGGFGRTRLRESAIVPASTASYISSIRSAAFSLMAFLSMMSRISCRSHLM